MTSKTRHQKKVEANRKKIVRLFNELKDSDMPRTVMWKEMSKKTGYTREGIQKVLREKGIDYSLNKK